MDARQRSCRFAAGVALALAITGCGGATSASPSPPTTPSAGSSGATVTIVNNAVTPQSVTVSLGNRVTFVNADSRLHDIESDPHPTHTDCPEINQVGALTPGQNHQTAALNVARVCGYHDHEQADAPLLQGTITIR
jgi:plastocyanin